MTGPIKRWNREVFGNIDSKIEKFGKEVAVVESRLVERVDDEPLLARLGALKSQLNLWYEGRACYYPYFHTMASIKNIRKLFLEIKVGRRIFRNPRIIKNEIRKFYKNLYKQPMAPNIQFQDDLVKRISDEEARNLEIFPSEEEIKNAV